MKLMIFIFGLLAFAPLGMADAGFNDPGMAGYEDERTPPSPKHPSHDQETEAEPGSIRSTDLWQLKNSIGRLERQIDQQNQEIRSLEDRVQQLDRQVRSLR